MPFFCCSMLSPRMMNLLMLCLLFIFDTLMVSPIRDFLHMERIFLDDSYVSFVIPTTEKSRSSHLSVCLFDSVAGEYKWILFGSVPFWGDTSAFKYDPSKESLADRNISITSPVLHHLNFIISVYKYHLG